MSQEQRLRELLKKWRNEAQLDRNKQSEMNERLNRGETVTVQSISGPFKDFREGCADQLEALLNAGESAQPSDGRCNYRFEGTGNRCQLPSGHLDANVGHKWILSLEPATPTGAPEVTYTATEVNHETKCWMVKRQKSKFVCDEAEIWGASTEAEAIQMAVERGSWA